MLKKRWRDLLFWLLVSGLLLLRAPAWFRAYQTQGKQIPPIHVSAGLSTSDTPLYDPGRGKQALVFWASWCGPCKIELSRLAQAVTNGKIPAQKILAVSTDQDPIAYRKAVQERNYPFPTALDRTGQAASALAVEVTPTLVLINEVGKIEYMGTGLSLIGPWRIQWHVSP
jgi:cytochrome c biogenesis protein CcmG/thiol:disulfide interchange protein DsbE